MPPTVLRSTASGRTARLGRISSVADLRARAAAAFLSEDADALCFAAVDTDEGPDDGEWVTVKEGHQRLTAVESDADLVAVLSSGCEEILVHGAQDDHALATEEASAPTKGAAVTPCTFTLNGEEVTIENADPRLTLLDYLRGVSGLTGTKGSCRQGGCGACTVMMEGLAINACLRPLVACDGHTITTTEGTGNVRDGYSKVQAAIAEGNGSQCGFCTPGMVMNMHSLLATKKDLSPLDLENHIDGNICRCTGYRPILASFKKLLAEGWRPACPGACKSAAGPPVAKHFSGTGGTQWSEPLSLADMCSAVSAAKASKTPYRIVAGNTGHGVYPDDEATLFLNAAKIPELALASGGAGAAITVGASVSINTLIDKLSSAKAAESGGISSHQVLAKHLGKVANNQVRNVGSWAGNLALCHANPTFQSDIATIMTAAGATVQIADAKGALTTHSLSEFYAMDDFTMLVSLTIPPASTGLLRTYKVMRRHQNAHAVVNAGFDCPSTSISTSEDGEASLMVTAAPVLVWGGLMPHPTRASKTEAVLVGKNLASQATLKLAITSLEAEFADITGKDVAYRKSLISSLFYKYWVEIMTLHNMPLPANQKIAGVPVTRPASTSTESYTPGVCDAIPKLASHRQAAGEAIYSDDNVPGVNAMYAAYVPSTVSCASIANIDASAALKMPGVIDFISASDLGPNSNFTQPVITPLKTVLGGRKIFADQPMQQVADGESQSQSQHINALGLAPAAGVHYFGQPLGVILADSREHAEYAAKHGVKATYTDVKKPVVTIDDAVAAGGSYVTTMKRSYRPPYKETPIETKRGDVAAAEKAAAHCGEGVVYSAGQYHFHMETQTVVAVPMESDGLRLHCATQVPSSIQTSVASAIGVSQNKVIIETKRCGGAFGGKLDNSVPGAVAVSFAAHKHRRECRMQLSIKDNMNTMGKRCPFKLSYKVCCDKDGKITAVSGTSYGDNSGPPTDFAMAYGIANWDVKGVQCNTNTPTNTAMRAPTHLGEELFIETIIDHVAQLVGKPPETIRALNITKGPYDDEANYVSSVSSLAQLAAPATLARPMTPQAPAAAVAVAAAAAVAAPPAVPEQLPAMFQAVMAASNITKLRADCAAFNKANLWRKRGVAAVPTEYNCGWEGVTQHGAKIDVYPDGTLLVFVTGVEVGQGLFTKCAQVAAMTLGLPDTSLIEVQSVDTSINPNGGGTGGSMTSGANAYGIQLACQELLKIMAPVVSLLESQNQDQGESQSQSKSQLTWQKKVSAAMAAGVDLSVKSWDHGMATSGNGYAAAVSVVEVDVLTGENQIISADLLYDCGKSLSPEIDLGQAEGAFMIGVGHFLTEGLEYDTTTGALLTFDTWEYKPPQCMDIPISWSTSFLANVENPTGFHGSKAIGEPPILMSAAVFFALKQAIYASRADAKMEGWVQLDAPASPAQVRQLLPSVSQLIG